MSQDYSPTIWLPRSDPASFQVSALLLNKLEQGVRDVHSRVAEPCMRVHTSNVNLLAAVVTADLDPGDRVLLTAQTAKAQNGVYTFDSDIEAYVRDEDEIYEPGRLFPTVTKTQLGLDEDFTNPELWACTDVAGADSLVFTRVSGGSASGASVKGSERVGAVLTWASDTVPGDCLLANGQPFTEAAFPELYAYAVTEVAAGNTLWTVNAAARTATVPNLLDRFIYGKGTKALAARSGGETHKLVPGEMPVHNHPPAPGYEKFWMTDDQAAPVVAQGTNFPANNQIFTTGNAGGDLPHNNMPPYVVLAFIIKAKSDPVSVNPAKRVKGVVTSAAAIYQGAGFTVARTAGAPAGRYTITFTPGFAAPPVVTPTASTQAGVTAEVDDAVQRTTTQVGIRCTTNAGVLIDATFHFVAEDAGLGLVATMDVEPWHLVGAAPEPLFANAWVNLSAANSGSTPTAFYKDPSGLVHIKGIVSLGNAANIFQLPPGYRPGPGYGNGITAWLQMNGGFTQVDIASDGWVSTATTKAAGGWVKLSGLPPFRAEA